MAGFAIDVATQGVIKEVGTTVVILRLWRVLEIIEELSSGAKEQMDSLFEHMEQLEADNEELKQELAGARGASKGGSGNGS